MKGRNTIPEHVAIIMDGNGRWARQHQMERNKGHQAGVNTVRVIAEAAARMGIRYLTLYTFSVENWKRPQAEVEALMQLLWDAMEEEIFMKNNISFRIIGEADMLPANVLQRMRTCEQHTACNTGMCLVLALSYSSKRELMLAARRLAYQVKEGLLAPEDITEEAVSQSLFTAFMPDPDLLIRTGGEVRLSNFLLWQSAYTELCFTETYWPDFSAEEFQRMIYDYQQRERRYGKTSEQI